MTDNTNVEQPVNKEFAAVLPALKDLPDDAARADALRKMCGAVLSALCQVMTQARLAGIDLNFQLAADAEGKTVVTQFSLSKQL